jgi:methionine-rich copper-binding protein CopC
MRTKITLTAAAALLLLQTPAYAHDLLVDINPAPGEVISTSSFEAVLTFNNPLLVIESETNAEFATKLQGTSDWATHPISIEDKTMVAQVELTEAGAYDLRWSVVGSDGHTISGDSNFVLEGSASEETAVPYVDIEPVTTSESQEIPALFYVGLALVALGAVFAPIGLMMRRKSKKSSV